MDLCKLFDKIRPDKKELDMKFGEKSPYEAIKEQLEAMKLDDGK